jgi:thermitase
MSKEEQAFMQKSRVKQRLFLWDAGKKVMEEKMVKNKFIIEKMQHVGNIPIQSRQKKWSVNKIMRKEILGRSLVVISISLLLVGTIPYNLGEAKISSTFAPGEVIVKFFDNIPLDQTEIDDIYTIIEEEPELNAVLIEVEEGTEQLAIQTLEARSDVEYAELNYAYELFLEPNDPLWPDQYGPKNINCPLAWDITLGSNLVKVAVVDTGIDLTHPDLQECYTPIGSWDFVHHDPYPDDEVGHGTHCAGIIAATFNNGIGIAGIAQVKIMAIKIGGASVTVWPWTAARGVIHAALSGADIISMSFGSWIPFKTMELACKFASNRGCILVAASGNENSQIVSYPARFESVIAVGATDENNARWSNGDHGSNYGYELEMMAPGVGIMSTMPTYHVLLNDYPYLLSMNYDYATGTSMACPHVAGALALYYSRFAFPELVDPEIARETLHNTAINLWHAGWDIYTGYGLVDVSQLVVNSVESQLQAENDFVTVYQNSMNNQIDVLANDMHSNLVTITIVSHPQCGLATTNGQYVYYSPTIFFTGRDTFTYTIRDTATGRIDTATVTVNVWRR